MDSPTLNRSLAFDFNGDRRTDLLAMTLDGNNNLQNTVSLQTATGTFQARALSSPTIDSGWGAQGYGDFDGDKIADDLFWRNFESGQTAIVTYALGEVETVNLTGQQSFDYFPQFADFNSDGQTDVFWQNLQGDNSEIWLIGAGLITQKSPVPIIATADLQWQLSDFNGDGKADLFWQDRRNGQLNLALMDGTTIVSQTEIALTGRLGEFSFGDFNGDGRTDIFDRRRFTGENQIWFWGADGKPQSQATPLPQIAPDSSVSFRDFDSDGRVEILSRSSATPETLSVWQIQPNLELKQVVIPRANVNDFTQELRQPLNEPAASLDRVSLDLVVPIESMEQIENLPVVPEDLQ